MDSNFKLYRKSGLQKMRPYIPGEVLSYISISKEDEENGSPKVGDMIAVGKSPTDMWLVAKEFFEDNYEFAGICEQP